MNLKATGKDSTEKVKLDVQEKKESAVSPVPGKGGVLLRRHPETDSGIVFLTP